jgi:hypothetical protein
VLRERLHTDWLDRIEVIQDARLVSAQDAARLGITHVTDVASEENLRIQGQHLLH